MKTMKPSELIAVLQQAVDAGWDNTTDIMFDTEARTFNYHMAKVDRAYFDHRVNEAMGKSIVILQEEHEPKHIQSVRQLFTAQMPG